MTLSGMVAMGNYSDSCICKANGAKSASNESSDTEEFLSAAASSSGLAVEIVHDEETVEAHRQHGRLFFE